MGAERATPAVSEGDRALSLGWPEQYGSVGVRRRTEKMDALWPLRGERLLDVGCGNGSYTTEMAPGFEETVGIEIETRRLEDFRRRLEEHPQPGVLALNMSAEDLEFADDHFDVVTAIEVIEHILDLDVAVREIARVLRPGGAFVITAPNRWFPIETHSFMVGGREVPSKYWPLVPWIPPLHRRLSTARNFRPNDLRRLLEPAGFAEVGIDYLMPPLEKWGPGRYVRPVTEGLERTRAKTFGVSVIAAYQRT